MSKPYDVSSKVTFDQHLPDWLTLVPRMPRGKVRIIDSDLATVTALADKVVYVDDPLPWILHTEFQSNRDPSLEWRVPWYNGILEYKHKCLVHSLVVLLNREAETPGLTGEWIKKFEGESPYRYLLYQVVRVWELHAEQLAKGSWGLFPLAPLCDDAKALMPGLIHRTGERLIHEYPDQAEAKTIWTVTETLLGLRYQDPLLSTILKEMDTMVDLEHSPSYQKIVAKGEVKSLREIILRMGTKKFGKPGVKVQREVTAITSVERLLELSERILDVETWKELLVKS